MKRCASSIALLLVTWFAVGCRPRAQSDDPPPSTSPPPLPPPTPPTPPPPPPSAFDELAAVPAPPPDMACDAMNAPQCMKSTRCVLVPPPQGTFGAYLCRPAQGPCEAGLAQSDPEFRANCVERSGCVFQDARCLCFPQTRVVFHTRAPVPNCFCGGGPPRMCVAAGT